MNSLVSYKNNSPYKMILLVVLYAIGATSLPFLANLFKLPENIEMLLFFILKVLTIVYAIYLVFSIGYKNIFKFNLKSFLFASLIYFPCILVCLNNIPFVAFLTKNASFNFQAVKTILYVLICLSIAVFEEVIFRGIIYPIFAEKTTDFKAILLSSAVFSLCHLVNAFSLNIGLVFMQLGYSFLIGAMCAVVFKKSKSIYLPILLHFVFDLGGLLLDYNLVKGNIWDTSSIIVTAVLGVITFVYVIIVYFKGYKNESSDTKS